MSGHIIPGSTLLRLRQLPQDQPQRMAEVVGVVVGLVGGAVVGVMSVDSGETMKIISIVEPPYAWQVGQLLPVPWTRLKNVPVLPVGGIALTSVLKVSSLGWTVLLNSAFVVHCPSSPIIKVSPFRSVVNKVGVNI